MRVLIVEDEVRLAEALGQICLLYTSPEQSAGFYKKPPARRVGLEA